MKYAVIIEKGHESGYLTYAPTLIRTSGLNEHLATMYHGVLYFELIYSTIID